MLNKGFGTLENDIEEYLDNEYTLNPIEGSIFLAPMDELPAYVRNFNISLRGEEKIVR